ncbi:SDR family NAD(P)-dependent oxidoreductase [Methyloceanibacter stevinii]|nr:SDR family oxidoreductase [Methyloceanibacter stevinii]
MFDFKDKVVLITGAAQGFGRVVAEAFAERGAKLALCDINDSGGEETLASVKTIGADGFYSHADISSEADVARFVAETVTSFGRLDVAINNASKEISGPTLDLPSEDFGTVIDTNLKGTYYCLKHEAAQMRKNGGGAIVNQASVTSSMTGVPDNGLYAATKGGIIGLTKSAALQVAAENISITRSRPAPSTYRTTCSCAGSTITKSAARMPKGWLPIKRLGKPEEIAAATLYLASDEARFAVGSVLTVDGGWTAQ